LTDPLNRIPQSALLRILALSRALAQPLDLSTMLATVLEVGRDVLDADEGSVWLYRESTESLDMYLPKIAPRPSLSIGQGLVGECFRTTEVLNIADCQADPRFDASVDAMTGYVTENILCIPLISFDDIKIGVLQLLNKKTAAFDEVDHQVALVLGANCAVAINRAQLIEAKIAVERYAEEIRLAQKMQQATLPSVMPQIQGYDIFGCAKPAEATGGDVFDLFASGSKTWMLLGDATGHGFGPALSATQMQGMFRVAFSVGANLTEACAAVNQQLHEDLPEDRFLTAFAGFLNQVDHTIDYHAAGQGPILHFVEATQELIWYSPTSIPLGVMRSTPFEIEQLRLAQGDIVAVLSDGIYESENDAGEAFGRTRTGSIVANHHQGSMAQLSQRILQTLEDYAGDTPQADDITLLLVQRT